MNESAIVKAAFEITDPLKRVAFIEKACGGNPILVKKIESLLAAREFDQTQTPETRANIEYAKTAEFSVDASNENDWANAITKSIDEDEDQIDLAFLKPPATPNAIGSLAHYEILQVLGQGGFGIVFKAFDEKLHRLVAIKVMNPQMAATSPPRKRFLREARSAAGVKHENIVGVYGVEEEPLPYLVMEYVDGFTLQQKLDEKGPLEPLEILHLGRQMANGLDAAHVAGLIHRDIKPGNILIEKGAEQRVKITDFGLARSVDDSSMTRTGVISGTPMYMAPEQAIGTTLDHRTDLFSLGSVLYQMCSGRPPFRAPTTIAVLRRVAEDTPRPIQEIIPETPAWMLSIIERLLQKNPDDRFQTAREVADLMKRYQSELQLNGKVTSYVGVAKSKSSDDGKKKSESKQRSTSRGVLSTKNKSLFFVAATIASITVVAGAILLPRLLVTTDVKPIQSTENSAVIPLISNPRVKVLPPIHGGTSLVPRPQAIAGLKSWGIVRSYPSGPFTGVGTLSNGKRVTTCVGSPCLFIHNDDWHVQQVLLPKPFGDVRDCRGNSALQVALRSRKVAFVNSSYVLCLYDFATEQILWQQQLKNEYDSYQLSFSHSEKWLAFAGNGKLKIFSSESGSPNLSIDLTAAQGPSPRSLCWSPNDKEIWLVGQDKAFYAYSESDLKEIKNHSLASNKLSGIDLAPDLSEAAFVSVEGDVRIIRCADWAPVGSWKLEKVVDVTECKWSPDKMRIAFANGNRIEVWDRSSQTKISDAGWRGKIAWKLDSRQVTSLFNHIDSLTLDIDTGRNLPVQFGPMKQKYMLGSVSPDGTNSVGVTDGEVVHFQTSTGRPDWRFRTPSGGTEISNHNDRIIIKTSWAPHECKVFRMSDRSELVTLSGKHATWSPDDTKIAMHKDPNTIIIHDSESGMELQRFEIEKGERIRTSWSPDGRNLAVRVAWEKPVLHIWDTKTEKLITHIDFPSTPSEVNNQWLSPAWRSNNSVLVPFADQIFEVSIAPDTSPIFKVKKVEGFNSVAIAHDVRTDRSIFSQFSGISVLDGSGKELFRFPTQSMGTLQWLPDGRRFVSSAYFYYELPLRGFDADKREQLGCCFPCLGSNAWLTIGPTGHYQGSEGIESEFRYVALHGDGRQKTYSAEEFAKTFQWKNDPRQATFLELVDIEH